MEPSNAIRERIAAKRQELQGLQRRIELIQAELRTWEQALALIAGVPQPQPSTPTLARLRGAGGPPRKRRLTDNWRRLLGSMATDPAQRHWSLDDMETLAEVLDIPMQRNTLRSQMSIYSDRNYVRRVKDGVYEVTETGAAEAGVSLGPAFVDADSVSAGDPEVHEDVAGHPSDDEAVEANARHEQSKTADAYEASAA